MLQSPRLTIVYWIALTIGLLYPANGSVAGFAPGSYGELPQVVHLLAFTILTVAVQFSMGRSRFWTFTMLLVGYAVATEAAQLLIPGRTATVVDGGANILGVVIGSLVACWRMGRAPSPGAECP